MDLATPDPLTYLMNAGVLGVVVVLWLTGLVVSKRELDRAIVRAGEWRAQYEQEAEAHLLTLRALERERERMDASAEAGRTATVLLQALGHGFTPFTGGGAT